VSERYVRIAVPVYAQIDAIHLSDTTLVGMGWLRFLAPPEKILRWVEGKMNLLGRLPHYVSVDQKTYGRYGVLPSTNGASEGGIPMNFMASNPRMGV
jgi:hypothetical protein